MVNSGERIRSVLRGAAGDVPAPQIYHYLDYRAFLRDYYRYRKARNARFSFRRLARDARLNSHSLIKMVMTGDRNLSEASATQLGKGCGLSGNELSYFLAVVQWNQCTSVDVRETYWQQILRRKPRVPFHELRANQLELLTNWRAMAILEMVRLSDFEPEPAWLARRFRGGLTAPEAEMMLEQLLAAGLLERCEGSLRPSHATFYGGGDVPNALIQMYHHKVARAGIEALAAVDVKDREFAASTIAVRRTDVARLKDEVRRFQRQILELAAAVDAPEEVYQLNVQLFPLTRAADGGGEG